MKATEQYFHLVLFIKISLLFCGWKPSLTIQMNESFSKNWAENGHAFNTTIQTSNLFHFSQFQVIPRVLQLHSFRGNQTNRTQHAQNKTDLRCYFTSWNNLRGHNGKHTITKLSTQGTSEFSVSWIVRLQLMMKMKLICILVLQEIRFFFWSENKNAWSRQGLNSLYLK